MIRILIADDHPLVRQGLRAVFATTDDIEVAGEARDGEDAVRGAVRLSPDVVLMDLQMPGLHGTEATRQVVAQRPTARVLVLTMFDDDDTVFAAMQAGATGYLVKGADGSDIVAAVHAAAAGQPVFGAALARTSTGLVRAARRPRTHRSPSSPPGNGRSWTTSPPDCPMWTSGPAAPLAEDRRQQLSAILGKLHLSGRTQAIVRARDAGLGRG